MTRRGRLRIKNPSRKLLSKELEVGLAPLGSQGLGQRILATAVVAGGSWGSLPQPPELSRELLRDSASGKAPTTMRQVRNLNAALLVKCIHCILALPKAVPRNSNSTT